MTVVTCGNCEKRKSVVGHERKSTCELTGEPVWGFVQTDTASNRCPLANEAKVEELQKPTEIKEGNVVEPNGEQQLVVTTTPVPPTTTAAPVTTTLPPATTTAAPKQPQGQQNQKFNQQQQNNRK